jgi:hypothetical protein
VLLFGATLGGVRGAASATGVVGAAAGAAAGAGGAWVDEEHPGAASVETIPSNIPPERRRRFMEKRSFQKGSNREMRSNREM